MTTIQAFLLGAMVSWTPGLVLLACQLWRAPLIESDEDASHAAEVIWHPIKK
jgi:hypothetical protein